MEVPSILDQIQWFEFVSGMTAEELEQSDQSRQHEDVIIRQVHLITDVVNGNLGFGLPPGTDSADGPIKDNIHGAWVRMEIGTGDVGAPITCTHNLNTPLSNGAASSTTLINVRWLVMCIQHDGTGIGANDGIFPPVFRTGVDAVTPNSIQLRVNANQAGGLTIDNTHPVLVDLFFIPAEQ